MKGRKTTRRNSTKDSTLISHGPFFRIYSSGKYESISRTIHVNQTIAIPNQAVRRGQQVVQTDAQANLLDDFVGVLGVDVVLDHLRVALLEI